MRNTHETGAANPLVISNVLLAIMTIAFGAAAIWAYTNYVDQRDNVDSKVSVAVADAKKEQAAEDEKLFLEREKSPFVTFVGPDDLGRVTFNYPKTWSTYIAKQTSTNFEAYLHPVSVPTIGSGAPYALRVTVVSNTYEKTLDSFKNQIKKGELTTSSVKAGDQTGIRLDGTFTRDIQGSMVVFKIRDKSLMISTQATTFKNDFDKTILKTLRFNP